MGLRGIGSRPLSVRHPGLSEQTPVPAAPGHLRPVFSIEAVALFLEIERTPGGHMPYTERSRKLAELLHLSNEWCSSCHVNDRSTRSHYPAGHLTDIAFWKVREVRKALLAAQTQATDVPADPTA
jgi:hypothetical protein